MSGRRGDAEARRARQVASDVLAAHFGSRPKRVVAKSGGATNHVFEAAHADGEFIVRLSPDATKIAEFQKEQWAIEQARAAGVPVPEVLQVGNEHGPFVYMVARRAEGEEATAHPERAGILEELGALAARIHGVRTDGWGSTFDWSQNRLSRNESWAQYLERELDVEGRLATLARHAGVDGERAKRLRRLLDEIGELAGAPRLNHGDLRLKNVLVDASDQITAVIDWEFATSNATPFWDTSLALHDLTIDEKHAYLAGYGLKTAELHDIAPHLKALNLINYAPYLQRAVDGGDDGHVERCRTRLSGALDLYSI